MWSLPLTSNPWRVLLGGGEVGTEVGIGDEEEEEAVERGGEEAVARIGEEGGGGEGEEAHLASRWGMVTGPVRTPSECAAWVSSWPRVGAPVCFYAISVLPRPFSNICFALSVVKFPILSMRVSDCISVCLSVCVCVCLAICFLC